MFLDQSQLFPVLLQLRQRRVRDSVTGLRRTSLIIVDRPIALYNGSMDTHRMSSNYIALLPPPEVVSLVHVPLPQCMTFDMTWALSGRLTVAPTIGPHFISAACWY